MSKILKGMQKMKLEQGFEMPVLPVPPASSDHADKRAERAELIKSIAIKLNATAICIVIGIVVYHLGSLLSGQSVTAGLIKEQHREIAVLSQQIKQANVRANAQDGRINDLQAAAKSLRKELRADVISRTEALDVQMKALSVKAARGEAGLAQVKQEYAGIKDALRQLDKKVAALQTTAVQQ